MLVWNLGENAKNAGNQRGDVQNQGGNLGIAVEMKQEGDGNDKFKEWREDNRKMNTFVKIQFYAFSFTKFIFSFTLDIFYTMLFCFYY